ncbi:hypothetical protein F4703DRAFT_1856331 [Phycomyces blakesleeanus]
MFWYVQVDLCTPVAPHHIVPAALFSASHIHILYLLSNQSVKWPDQLIDFFLIFIIIISILLFLAHLIAKTYFSQF